MSRQIQKLLHQFRSIRQTSHLMLNTKSSGNVEQGFARIINQEHGLAPKRVTKTYVLSQKYKSRFESESQAAHPFSQKDKLHKYAEP